MLESRKFVIRANLWMFVSGFIIYFFINIMIADKTVHQLPVFNFITIVLLKQETKLEHTIKHALSQ